MAHKTNSLIIVPYFWFLNLRNCNICGVKPMWGGIGDIYKIQEGYDDVNAFIAQQF